MGHPALDILQHDETIDLLFTDIVMPGGMTGVELAREARKIRPLLKILLTPYFGLRGGNGAKRQPAGKEHEYIKQAVS